MENFAKNIYGGKMQSEILQMQINSDKIPFLTVGKNKNGRKASKIKLCSRFLFRNDMCYIFVLGKFIILVSLIMPRIVDFLMNS